MATAVGQETATRTAAPTDDGPAWLALGAETVLVVACLGLAAAALHLFLNRTEATARQLLATLAALFLLLGVGGVLSLLQFGTPALGLLLQWAIAAAAVVAALMSWRHLPIGLNWPGPEELAELQRDLDRQAHRRHSVMDQLRQQKAEFASAFDRAPIGMALLDGEGRLLRANAVFAAIGGRDPGDLPGRSLDALLIDAKGQPLSLRSCQGREGTLRRPDGERRRVDVSITPVTRAHARDPERLLVQLIDITRLRQTEAELQAVHRDLEARVAARTAELEDLNRELARANRHLDRLAHTDPLTGLPNRRHLLDALERQLQTARRYRTAWCLLMFDIDHFKAINDRHGHVNGDRALAAVGGVLRASLRETDIAGRFGGDEFCIGLPHASLEDASRLAEKLRRALRNAEVTTDAGDPIALDISLGAVAWTPALDRLEQLIQAADEALYEAKRRGRGRVNLHMGPP